MALTTLPTSWFFFSFTSLSSMIPVLFLYLYIIYYIILFLCDFCQAAVSVKISNFFVCFCSFDLSCPILEKDNFIKFFYCIVMYY